MSRRFISVSQKTYRRMEQWCRAEEARTGKRVAVAGTVERLLNRWWAVQRIVQAEKGAEDD